MGRGSPRPLPGPSHLSISGFALGSGFAPNSRALRAPIRALPSILGRFRPSIKASPSILGRNLGRFAPSVRALPSIYPLRNFDLVAPLGEGFGRKHGKDKWDWNGYYFHTGTCFFPNLSPGHNYVLGMTLNSSVGLGYDVKSSVPWRLDCGHACAFGRVDEAVSGGKPSAGKGVVGMLSSNRTFEFVLHFVRCVTVTVSPNQIIIIIIIIVNYANCCRTQHKAATINQVACPN